MQDLPSLFRQLADACEANGGILPDALLQPEQKPERRKKKFKTANTSGNVYTQQLAKEHFHGRHHH